MIARPSRCSVADASRPAVCEGPPTGEGEASRGLRVSRSDRSCTRPEEFTRQPRPPALASSQAKVPGAPSNWTDHHRILPSAERRVPGAPSTLTCASSGRLSPARSGSGCPSSDARASRTSSRCTHGRPHDQLPSPGHEPASTRNGACAGTPVCRSRPAGDDPA